VRVVVVMAPVVLITGLMDIDRGRTSRCRDSHDGRDGQEKDCQKS